MKKAVGGTLIRPQRNPPFDKRIITLPGPAGAPGLQRGHLRNMNVETTDPWFGGPTWTTHFLYNPSTISLSHGVTDNLLPPAVKDANDVTTYLGATNSTVSWSLLFDRTYETWDRSYKNKPAGKYGVYVDIRSLYGMLGMVRQRPIPGLDLISSPMLMKPVQVYFGGKNSLSYYGRIESLTIDYTHWTVKMVPNRCVVNITLTIYPKPGKDVSTTAPGNVGSRGGTKARGNTRAGAGNKGGRGSSGRVTPRRSTPGAGNKGGRGSSGHASH